MSRVKRFFAGFTLLELLVVIAVIGILAGLLIPAVMLAKKKAFKMRCKSNLFQLGRSFPLYADSYGRTILYPEVDGSPFLLRMYIVGIVTESDMFLCPATLDDNEKGKRIPDVNTGDAQNFCSYAGRKNSNQWAYPGIFTTKNSSQTTISADDFSDSGVSNANAQKPTNHDEDYNFLFLDGHADEYSANSEAADYAQYKDPLDN